MAKSCEPHISYWKRTFFGLVAIAIVMSPPPQAWGVNVNSDKEIVANTTDTNQQVVNAANITLTVNGTLDFTGTAAVNVNGQTGATIINNAGATIQSTANATIRSITGTPTGLTITNSGTIQSTGSNQAIQVQNDSNFTLTNNAGGLISGVGSAINFVTVGGTINNSGTISTSASNGQAIQTSAGTGLTLNNNAGGVISAASIAVRIFDNNTINNSGTISSDSLSFSIRGNNNTIILKEGSIIVGNIGVNAGLTGNTLKIEQGFGQTYF